jgi:hypothetical protein
MSGGLAGGVLVTTIPWLADVLRAAGVQVVEEGDWRNRMVSGSFDPIGVLWHHTAATSSASNPAPALGVVINGRSDLQGPLCHALVDYNGVFHLISAGRANHAGVCGGSGPLPYGDGNTMLIGWEIDYNGVSQEMSPAQYAASVKATAAVLRHLGRDANYARGHRETSVTGKIDPSFINLDTMRSDVAKAMAGKASQRRGASGGLTVAWAEGRLDVFGRGGGGSAYHNFYQRDVQGAVWPDWRALPGSTDLRSQPVSVSWGEGRLDVFAIGASQKMQHWWFDRAGDNRWRGPEVIGDALFVGTPSVVSFEPGRIDVFGRDANNALRHNHLQRGGAIWPSWDTLGGASLAGNPAAVMWGPGRWDVFAVGSDLKMRHWWFDRQGESRWRGAQTLGDTTFTAGSTPAAVSWDAGRIDVFGRDANDALRHNYVQSGVTAWPRWADLGDALSSPNAVTWGPGRLDVFAIGTGTTMRHWWFDRQGDNTWRGPETLGGTTFTNTIDVVSWGPGRLDVFGIDSNHTMRHNHMQSGVTTWYGWQHLGGIFQ